MWDQGEGTSDLAQPGHHGPVGPMETPGVVFDFLGVADREKTGETQSKTGKVAEGNRFALKG